MVCQSLIFLSQTIYICLTCFQNKIIIFFRVSEPKMEKEKVVSDAKENHKDLKDKQKNKNANEIGGREGPDPVRYGDWENNGIASDF